MDLILMNISSKSIQYIANFLYILYTLAWTRGSIIFGRREQATEHPVESHCRAQEILFSSTLAKLIVLVLLTQIELFYTTIRFTAALDIAFFI